VALDEGSRTSAALTQILLAERCGVRPRWDRLAIGSGIEATDADAVLLIGDRAISDFGLRIADCEGGEPIDNPQSEIRNPKLEEEFVEIWDLGEQWTAWTGLPFVFAMWVARDGVDASEATGLLEAARDRGQAAIEAIAAREAPVVGISRALAERYLRENLHFTLGGEERAGLRNFYELCVAHGLAPRGLESLLSKVGGVRAGWR
jgi:chorismate dehydratase